MGLSWTVADDEAARVLLASFGSSRAAGELLERADLRDVGALFQTPRSRLEFWRELLSLLRASDDAIAIDRLLRVAVELQPDLAPSLRAAGTSPPAYGGESRRVRRLPPIGLSSRSPDRLEAPPHEFSEDLGGVESLERLEDDSAAADSATSFARDPVVAPRVPPRAGGPLVLSVDLARPTGPSTSQRITVSGLPADWQSLPIVARATGVGVTFDAGGAEGVVLVRRDASSIACTLVGTIAADATRVTIAVAFYERGRYCGEVAHALALDGTEHPAPIITGAMIEPGIEAPDLTVVVRNLDADRPGLLHWDLRLAERHQVAAIRDLPRELSGELDLRTDPRPWALELFDEFAASDTGDRSLLEAIGEKLWAATPECFRQTYWALRAAAGEQFSIQFVCGEPFVPWEFLRPTRGDESLPILMQNHPVARWMPAYAGTQRGSFAGQRIITIAAPRPSSPPLPELKAAQAQSDRLRDRFHAEPRRATKQDVLSLLESTPEQPIAIVHFAGHGAIDANLDKARIFLDDEPLQSLLVDRSEIKLGKAGRTLVFLNACSVGNAGRTLGTPAGWPGAFLNRGFRGFLAPISKVWELDAAQFAERFVALTWRDRKPIGEALRQLRAGADSTTPFAYIYYGDVMARFA